MLATTGAVPTTRAWSYEPKLDGWRALVYVTDGVVAVRSRRNKDLTASLPELHPIAVAVGQDAVLDGELVADDGRPESFYGLLGRMATKQPRQLATFMAFDVLALGGRDLTGERYMRRREVLAELALEGLAWGTVPSFDLDAAAVGLECVRLGLEGMVAKRHDSTYRCGQRTAAWRKFKTATWRRDHLPLRPGVASHSGVSDAGL
jgi:bifunctional non-homologous end joining protein LigD